MKKDNFLKGVRAPNSLLRVASINNLRQEKNSDNDENPPRESKRSRLDEEKDSDIPQFYHHPRRPRNFDPL